MNAFTDGESLVSNRTRLEKMPQSLKVAPPPFPIHVELLASIHVCEAGVFQYLQYNHACISVLVNYISL